MIYHDFVCEFESTHRIAMQCFFHVLRVHDRIIRSRAFVARICHIVFWLDSSRNKWKFEKNVWFQTLIFFLFLILIIFHFERTIFEFVMKIVERCCRRINDESKHAENDLRLAHEIAFESVERVLSFVFSFDAFCISTIMQCAHDLHTFRTFYTF